jgi:hypothetical protein
MPIRCQWAVYDVVKRLSKPVLTLHPSGLLISSWYNFLAAVAF